MAAVNPSGTTKHWIDGRPMPELNKAAIAPGTDKYWLDGLPVAALYPAAAIPPVGGATFPALFIAP